MWTFSALDAVCVHGASAGAGAICVARGFGARFEGLQCRASYKLWVPGFASTGPHAGDRVLYDRLFDSACRRVQHLEASALVGRQFSQVLELLLRLRQLCSAAALLPRKLLEALQEGRDSTARALEAAVAALGSARVDALLQNLAAAQEDDCSICMCPGCDIVTRCGHVFHRECLDLTIRELGSAGVAPCPLCRQSVRQAELLEKPPDLEDVEAAAGVEEPGACQGMGCGRFCAFGSSVKVGLCVCVCVPRGRLWLCFPKLVSAPYWKPEKRNPVRIRALSAHLGRGLCRPHSS